MRHVGTAFRSYIGILLLLRLVLILRIGMFIINLLYNLTCYRIIDI